MTDNELVSQDSILTVTLLLWMSLQVRWTKALRKRLCKYFRSSRQNNYFNNWDLPHENL